ncbi:ribose 1,5-bisphosphokinase [Humitalea rosea]|uniref:Ribose 1,5-bisphosphate phosphokinase PhnN n=1 Tax=Humitalea rosea TaxID=990373 RepID=A0A2W7ITM6_9PROT|nr:phosphonate metabolism protein/1,5-bisphosphokinase (PRPP-forming) PhnN [Humitalea rosea]PZW50864.1 ribose 1,5-bisphosphokinase [Humitalea rosea]
MLIAVVGASGAGKDTLLDKARVALADEPRVVWVRRVITRPIEAGGEAHFPATEEEFTALAAAGAFCLHWPAHGLRYGIPAEAGAAALAGDCVIANLSRAILSEAAARFPLRVLHVTVPDAIRAARLAARGREDAASVMARLSRVAPLPPGLDVVEIVNDGTPEEGAARMLAAIRRSL